MKPNFLDEVADYLVAQGVAADASVKVNKTPANPDTLVSIYGLPGTTLGVSRDVSELEFPRFQVLVRAPDYVAASDLIANVRTTLHGKIGLLLPHYRVMRLHAEQEGGPIGEDDQGRSEFTINFATEYHYMDSI